MEAEVQQIVLVCPDDGSSHSQLGSVALRSQSSMETRKLEQTEEDTLMYNTVKAIHMIHTQRSKVKLYDTNQITLFRE